MVLPHTGVKCRKQAKGPGWSELAISPNYHWLMAYLYQDGYYWIYLPTGTMVPLPSCQGCWVRFVAWLPGGAGM